MMAVLSEEQILLRDAVRSLADDHALIWPTETGLAAQDDGWAALARAGLLGLRACGESGNPLASGVELMIVLEALADRLVPVPYLGSAVIAEELLRVAGAPQEWSTGLAEGDSRYAVMFAPDLMSVATQGDALAYDARGATRVLRLARTGSDLLLECWTTAAIRDIGWIDLTRTMAEVSLGSRIGTIGLSLDQLDRWLALSLMGTSADMVGAMAGALTGVVDYAKQRFQFGKPIGSFQAVQHLCAEAHVAIEASRSLTNYAAWAVDAVGTEDALLASRTAKAYSSRVARTVCEIVMQVYGGIGQTWESKAHLYLRRVLGSRELLGGENAQHLSIADLRLGVA
jgi:alkylation response protein AidB-like acyl-CoA dehydrogenase